MEVDAERIKKDIETISAFNITPGQGVTRLTFTPEYMRAYRYVIAELHKIGAEVTIRRAGCLRGRRAGGDPNRPAVLTGSHLDTVLNGGRFDGPVGVFAALEAARVIVANKVPHAHPIDVAVFTEEEGARFGRVLAGSSAWSGGVDVETVYQARDKDGISFEEAMAEAGVVPDDDSVLEPGEIKAMLELHIEQSVVLDREGLSVGVVESVAGLKWFTVTIEGAADHAGGTPMAFRRDAFQGAVRIIAAVEDIAARQMGPHTVATVGFINVEPGSINVIPGKVVFSLDVRDSAADNLALMPQKIKEVIEEVCRARGLKFKMEPRLAVPPVIIPEHLAELIAAKARNRGLATRSMMSGALHDACKLAALTDIGLIFVPSKDGRSHCPEEWTDWPDIAQGANVLLDTVVELAK